MARRLREIERKKAECEKDISVSKVSQRASKSSQPFFVVFVWVFFRTFKGKMKEKTPGTCKGIKKNYFACVRNFLK